MLKNFQSEMALLIARAYVQTNVNSNPGRVRYRSNLISIANIDGCILIKGRRDYRMSPKWTISQAP